MSAHSQIAAPFDTVASRYDQTFTSSKIGQAQRAAVWAQLARTFHTGERVLDIGCGTGVDACFLAGRGVQVVACDPSTQMIQVLARRLEQTESRDLVQPCVLSAEDLMCLQSVKLFDGAFSNFGAINCVADLRKLAVDLARLLRPAASVLLCWMSPYCLWEQIWYLLHGSRQKAFRRLKQEGVPARIADGAFVHVRYPSVKFLRQTFTPEFRLKSVQGVGVAVPPSYLEGWAQRYPRSLQVCGQADSWLARCPGLKFLGDHVLIRLERQAVASSGS
jgi:ubiquinone/menaquinone biosynthesis C-methylase UbiE